MLRLHPEPGFYLDMGANSAIDLSNTFALDRRGWRGVAVDPFPADFGSTAANRTCAVVAAAVSGAGGMEVRFVRPVNNTAIGGILDTLDTHKNAALAAAGTRIVKLRTLGIRELLAGRSADGSLPGNLPSVPRHIDYLSLDVEGQEATILEAWPFDMHSIGLITVEHNYEEPKRRRIREVLLHNGFHYAHHVDVDDWYVNDTLYGHHAATSEPLTRPGTAAVGDVQSAWVQARKHVLSIAHYVLLMSLAVVIMTGGVALGGRWRARLMP